MAQELVSKGGALRTYDERNLAAALQDVDVVVNTIGPSGHHFKEQLLRSLPQTNVNLYFPSEFGVNHYIHDFEHEEWDAKKHHYKLATELIPNIKICRVYAGLFLEDSIGPWFGFNTKDGKYEAVGDATRLCSYTSIYDVGKAVAILASKLPAELPAEIQLNGDAKSFAEIAEMMKDAGAGSIDVSSIPLESYKQDVLAKPSPTPERYLRFLIGEGKIDHSENGLGNHNALVQSNESFGRWMTIRDLATETNGRPWADTPWPPAAEA